MFITILDILTFMIALSMASMVFQLWRNRNVPDRAVAADQISVHVMALIALHAIRQDVSAYLDLLIVFSMLGFFSSIAVARYFEASMQKENRNS
ncbi:MAG: monovalent cation/H+ antiporter complex subunit F [Chloroflexi bacterium]|nr:monovalent cation/H+ antiporter complex subunit F [Chloroflexota bacterium]